MNNWDDSWKIFEERSNYKPSWTIWHEPPVIRPNLIISILPPFHLSSSSANAHLNGPCGLQLGAALAIEIQEVRTGVGQYDTHVLTVTSTASHPRNPTK